jgi:hypothetical protein
MKLLGVEWFNKVGIVRCEGNLPGDIRYYIKAVDGFDEEYDTIDVMNYDNKFPRAAGDALFGAK